MGNYREWAMYRTGVLQWRKLKHHLFESDYLIINWSDYDKGRLLLFFGMLSQISVLKWCIMNFYYSNNNVWFNPVALKTRVMVGMIVLLLFTLLAVLSFSFKHHALFRLFLSYFAPVLFGVGMIYGGYMVGIYSPATMAGTVNLLLVGLVFYRPAIMLSIMLPITIFIGYICYFTSHDRLEYAPIFSHALKQTEFYDNHFWLLSMAELYLPILIISAVFFQILLVQWRHREQKMEVLSRVDGLTNVYNRRFVSHELQQLTQSHHPEFAVVLLDLDFFKLINDKYGHETGDRVLKGVAQILNDNTRKQDVVGRFGGEEFILILKDQNLEQAIEVSERCRAAILSERFNLAHGGSLEITASFGVATAVEGTSPELVTRLADQALYLAKQQGRNQVRSFRELNLDLV
ncbi:hypothetical protein B9T33_14610 [Acinetobacter sp. ANC 5054]|uniref:GGDEF domain-containing protein n=1 Tax=Acinetobacter sp. ANC 5054 TaxID=1977877 RepID=UPI000A34DF28|nr:GGDEF domain-containing protein [Acinetobacter sp. ANC 5054]OTG78018.1 hypothetical protein B9T33_14610 [Acinetobacter sp. ANC 5054]